MAQGKRGRPPKKPVAQKISSALDIAQEEINSLIPIEEQNSLVPAVISPEVIVQEAPKISKDVRDDYDFARTNLYNLLAQGNTLLDGIAGLANDSDSARTYEVAGNLLKTLFEGTRELMTLQKDIRDVEKKSIGAGSENNSTPVNIEHANDVTNNTMVFEGSTLDMLDIMNELKRKKQEVLTEKEHGN